MVKIGDHMLLPVKEFNNRNRYDSQFAAEIKFRNHYADATNSFREGAYIVRVVGIITNETVENEY